VELHDHRNGRVMSRILMSHILQEGPEPTAVSERMQGMMSMRIRLWGVLLLVLGVNMPGGPAYGKPDASRKGAGMHKIVLIAGSMTGHDKYTHEYERSVILLKYLLDTAANLKNVRTEAYFHGWPQDEHVLDDANTIVLVTDGSDRNEQDHPLYVGDRIQTLERQMRRGCGFVQFHWSTFAPSRFHDRITEWIGGYFDYETGSAPNHWYSAIQTYTGPTRLGTEGHPICRGVRPFTVEEEFYYRIRFRQDDPRVTPILLTRPPHETQDYPVGWAVQRQDGGRGFGFTGGHFYKNWWLPDFRKLILNAIVWTAGMEVPPNGVETRLDPPVRALVLTGHHHPGHDWRQLTAALIQTLEQDPRVNVDVTENIEDLASSGIDGYNLLVMNYNNWELPGLSDAAKAGFVRYLQNGGGLELIHFANGAFNYTLPNKGSDWKEYRTRIVRRAWMHDLPSGHDPYGPFHVDITAAQSPITAGLQPFDTEDELYFKQVGDQPITPLVTAHSKVTGHDEPLAWAYRYGKGRIFQTLLGHDGRAVRSAGALIRRGAVWAAGRDPLTFDPPVALLTGAPFRNGSPWTIEKSLQLAAAHSGAAGQPPLVDGHFGKALNGRAGGAFAPGRADYRTPPLTVECWAKLHSKGNYNILIANENKSSLTHWEMFTVAGTGRYAVYMPGKTPDHTRTDIDICDDRWHYLAMVYTAGRVRLYVDGKQAADQAVQDINGAVQPGDLAFGSLVSRELGCDGLIDDVRISRSALDINSIPAAPLAVEDATVGLWRFDQLDNGRFADIGRLNNPALVPAAPVAPAVAAQPMVAGPLPVIDRRASVDWLNVGNDKGGMRYSPLKQINRANVRNLRVAWTYHGGGASPGSTIECTPVVAEGVMYVTTPDLKIVALDAATGREIWKVETHAGGVNRGIGYWSDNRPNGQRRVFMGTPDGRLISLDARTGIPDPAFGKNGTLDLRIGIERDISGMTYGVTSAPAIFENLVIPGYLVTEAQPGAPGDIRAFDVHTGKEVWRFHTAPWTGEAGNETWENDGWKERSGVNAWSGFTLDERRGILFCGTGSASSDFYGADRKGANLFANCTLALDIRTGKRLWHFQQVHHDLWDHDNPCPPVLCTVMRDGKKIDAVAQLTKTGYCYLFDRVTGKLLFDVKEVPAPPSDIPGERAYPTQPEPVKPPAFSPNLFTDADVTDISSDSHDYVVRMLQHLSYGKAYLPPTVQGTVVAPGFHGGATWSGGCFDPTTGLLYVNSNNVLYISVLQPNSAGGYDFGGYTYFNDQYGYPANKPPWGSLTAIDVSKGEFAWQAPLGEYPALKAKGVPQTGTENFGGTIVTAGGLVFIGGTKDERFHAFDKATGKVLWEEKLPNGGYATPCTYMVNGRQYVAIAAGGGGKLRTRSGDAFVVFALPDGHTAGRENARK
jgi:quinoprotein glucose dehydrogenase